MNMGEGKAGITKPDPCNERGGKQGTKEREGMKGKFQMLHALPHEIHRNRIKESSLLTCTWGGMEKEEKEK